MSLQENCFLKVKNDYLNFLNKEEIYIKSTSAKIKNLKKIYIPISFWINSKCKKNGRTLFLGLSGSQGSGKTTVAGILKIILKNFFKKQICVISIDDFYKTLSDRKSMSQQKHPLFKTRGVPGTHDVNLIIDFFKSIKKKKFKKIKLPKFDKSIDDRLKKSHWHNVYKKPEIIILEGWCVGAKAQTSYLLKRPVNNLEKNEDKNLIWRNYVNEKLKKEYKKVFAMIDYLIFLKVPNLKMVFKWRHLQESKLKKISYNKKKIMSYSNIKRFIMFYQRITLQMMKDLSKSASVVMLLKNNHEIKKVLFKS